MVVRQLSNWAVIDWEDFSIGEDELVEIVQPGYTAIAVIRIIGDDASVISGRVMANGRIFLLNSNGVLFETTSIEVMHIVKSL